MPVLVDTPGGQGEELLRTLPGVRELGEVAVAWAVVDMPLDTPAAMPGMFASASVGWIAPSVPSVVVWLPLPVWLPPLQLVVLPSPCLSPRCSHYVRDECW